MTKTERRVQQVVLPADVARKMFPLPWLTDYGWALYPPLITWLAGPIKCDTCRGTQINIPSLQPCTGCLGLGYPPIVEIVIERIPCAPPHLRSVHGRLALGTPVPVHPWETEDYDNVPSVEIRADGTIWYYDQAYCDDRGLEVKPTNITDAVAGTLAPGGLAYPLTVAKP